MTPLAVQVKTVYGIDGECIFSEEEAPLAKTLILIQMYANDKTCSPDVAGDRRRLKSTCEAVIHGQTMFLWKCVLAGFNCLSEMWY